MTGIIVSYHPSQGYGFIQPLIGKPDSTPNVYFHSTAICRKNGEEPALPRGAEVKFDLVRADGGRVQAANIRLMKVNASALAG